MSTVDRQADNHSPRDEPSIGAEVELIDTLVAVDPESLRAYRTLGKRPDRGGAPVSSGHLSARGRL